ncbi:MAG: transposase [Deltaproteobacteria bacterium]|nr:transposase [Deltaproteobacteria bacterium]
MARALRLSFEDAVYHITARGNRKENIFYSDKDKETFLDKMNEAFQKYSFICYVYCLMDNHYHLFIKTPFANLSEGMHYLNTSYANWFRAKYKFAGSVFQGRYKSILVDGDNYALMLSAYIHLNPVRAGMVKLPQECIWSSFLDYSGGRKPVIERLDTSFILKQLDDNIDKAISKYSRFVIENINMKSPLEKSYKNIALGSEKFIEKIKEKVSSLGEKREISQIKDVGLLSKEQIVKTILMHFNINRDMIFEKRRGNIYRKLALYLLKNYSALSLKQIGELFNMDYVAASQAAKRFEKEMKKDRMAEEMVNSVIKTLKEGGNVKC